MPDDRESSEPGCPYVIPGVIRGREFVPDSDSSQVINEGVLVVPVMALILHYKEILAAIEMEARLMKETWNQFEAALAETSPPSEPPDFSDFEFPDEESRRRTGTARPTIE